jgi:hypothetical protein
MLADDAIDQRSTVTSIIDDITVDQQLVMFDCSITVYSSDMADEMSRQG